MTQIVENYNIEEKYLYNKPYLYIKGYATAKNMTNTLKALPLARRLHNGQYRKGKVIINGNECRLPYVLHVLKVCSTLFSLNLPMSDDELDIMGAGSLLHDSLEDSKDSFQHSGEELITEFGFPESVYAGIKTLSKRSGATQEELFEYFNNIKRNKITLLVKLADRSHNVEDLYVMRTEKLHEYVKETRSFIYPLCSYGKQNYPELSNGITVLKAKILSLTEATEAIVEQYEEKIKEKDREIEELKTKFDTIGI